MKYISQVKEARQLLKHGKVIAYPTEAVYGIGCNPFNPRAVEKLLALKQRDVSKGFIILIAGWSELKALIKPVPEKNLAAVRHTWPGPVTWVFPKADIISDHVSGCYPSIAIRMTSHPLLRELCADGPVISTSANLSGCLPAMDVAGVEAQFPDGLDAILIGPLGGLSKPSNIYDVISGKQLR